MNNEFKKLLLKIANLPLADQKWVLNQLTPKQLKQFTQWQGDSLLNKARRFRKLPCPQLPQISPSPPLPDLCKQLTQQSPLYIAIILEQGQFKWAQEFIESHEQREEIKQLIHEGVCFIKPATKKCTFKQWQDRLSFMEQLENIHG
ncbi:hypothetical protein [Legionella maioricensis]|uniref:Uncharacterized protein n=1 Tax=Legionella maioricensis TaxID=2896528 RepID=A0A9X2CXJ1_9GAMM|nr:hypothetical protein [Legionella maioricensis]MCL9682633.1 hypothetical protein [Legionella maioricensis]MCL9687320.1 hypothetical protein [Legionella maioricensis]